MRKPFHDVDFQSLADFWNAFYPPEFAVDGALLRAHTVECPVFDWGASVVQYEYGKIVGFAAFKQSATPKLYKGSDRDHVHLSAIGFTDPQIGLEMLAEAKRLFVNRGDNKIVFGQDSHHFFPGCPKVHKPLCNFLLVEGFEDIAEVVDLERDLKDYRPPRELPSDFLARPLVEADLDELRRFLGIEFSPRWQFDSLQKANAEGPRCIHGLFQGGLLKGFALLQNSTQQHPIGGAVWKSSLGENWGALGPIGIAKDIRGKGVGSAFLGACLTALRDFGVRRCIIDWTGLADFYAKHGFEVTRRYRCCSLSLERNESN
jgi:GNAT superfamily N-acetyltransferase